MRKLTLFLLLCPLLAMAESKEVKSPDGKMVVEVRVDNGLATYAVEYDGVEMIKPSRLGLDSSFGYFESGLSYVSDKEETVEKEFDISRTKTSHISYKANRLDMTVKNSHGQQMVITFLCPTMTLPSNTPCCANGVTRQGASSSRRRSPLSVCLTRQRRSCLHRVMR